MKKNIKWSVTQFCPICYAKGEIKSVFLEEEDRSLNCLIHGKIGFEDSNIAKYTTIDINKPVENNNVIIEPELEVEEADLESTSTKEIMSESENEKTKFYDAFLEEKFDFFKKNSIIIL